MLEMDIDSGKLDQRPGNMAKESQVKLGKVSTTSAMMHPHEVQVS